MKICFEAIGLNQDDCIVFIENDTEFMVKSKCNPDGGQFIRNDNAIGEGWHTIRLATRILIGSDRLHECNDIWSLWAINGVPLRIVFEQQQLERESRSSKVI